MQLEEYQLLTETNMYGCLPAIVMDEAITNQIPQTNNTSKEPDDSTKPLQRS